MTWPLALFVFAGLFSPGPNVILLTLSGLQFGFRQTLPHVLGVALGVGGIAALSALGLGVVLQQAPQLAIGLKGISAIWILYLAYRLWITDPSQGTGRTRPFTFIEAVLFQLVNPKIWSVTIAAMAYVLDLPLWTQVGLLALMFSGINLGVCLFWTFVGAKSAHLLTRRHVQIAVMRGMALLLALSVGLLFLNP